MPPSSARPSGAAASPRSPAATAGRRRRSHGRAGRSRPRASRGHADIEGESEYLFWHALARDVAYGQLPRKARARKHEAAALWIEGQAGERGDEFAEILAHHYVAALDLARSMGDEGQAASLVAPTIAHSGAPVSGRCASTSPSPSATSSGRWTWPERTRERGWSFSRAGRRPLMLRSRYREAASAYEEAIEGLRALGDIRTTAAAMCWLANVLPVLGKPSFELMQAAVDLLAEDGPSPELAEVLGHYALGLDAPGRGAAVGHRGRRSGHGDLSGARTTRARRGHELSRGRASATRRSRRRRGQRAGDRGRKGPGPRDRRATLELNQSRAGCSPSRGASAERLQLIEAHEFVGRHGIEIHIFSVRVRHVETVYKTGKWDEALRQAADLLPQLEAVEDIWNILEPAVDGGADLGSSR